VTGDDDGWYARQAEDARARRSQAPDQAATQAAPRRTSITKARPFESAGQTILQWSRSDPGSLRR
jgi:hypothetical protein